MQAIFCMKYIQTCWAIQSIKFTSVLDQEIDILFLCVGHGEAKKFLQENEIDAADKDY